MATSPRQDHVFQRIWLAHSVSQVGTSVSQFALPLLAVRTLGASESILGLLLAAATLPLLVLGLFIGVWVDRRPRLPLMLGADLVRVGLIALIPLAWWLERLSLGLLFAVVILVGICSVLFDVASQALVNTILPRQHLIAGNARMHTSHAVANIAGPASAGLLLRLLPIPLAFAIDAVSFAISALFLTGARTREVRSREARTESVASTTGMDDSPAGGNRIDGVLADVRTGLRFVVRNPTLRTLTVGVAVWNLFTAIAQGMFVIYLLETIELSALTIGLVTALGGAGFLVGTLLPGAVTTRLGLGRGIVVALLVTVPAILLVASASGPPPVALIMLLGGYIGQEVLSAVADINQFALRNAVTPDHLRGRVASAARVILRSTVPVGFFLGGLIAEHVGLRAAMVTGAIGPVLFAALVLRSPIMAMREIPEVARESGSPAR